MLDLLDQFLKNSVTPELYASMESADEVFEQINIADSVSDDYHAILMRDTTVEQTTTEIIDYTVKTLDNLLNQHGVLVNHENTFIDIRVAILKGLLLIPDYENQNEIATIAEMDLDSDERLAEILALVLPQEAEELLYHIESVSGALVRKIIEQAKSGVQIDDIDAVERAQCQRLLAKLKNFSVFMKQYFDDDLFIVEAIRSHGVPVNMNFMTYASLIGRDFEALHERLAAANLVGMALVSFDGCDNPMLIIQKNIESFISNMDKITRISGFATREILSLFAAWESKQQ